ncbi:hypothetical protein Tco_1393426 [Tanacetum coccineum]
MERDCQHGLYKAGMGSSRVLSDFAEKYGSKNRVLAGFGIGGKSGKEKESEHLTLNTWVGIDSVKSARKTSQLFFLRESLSATVDIEMEVERFDIIRKWLEGLRV